MFLHFLKYNDRIPVAEVKPLDKFMDSHLIYKHKREYAEMCGFMRERVTL